ncbi:MAG: Crp/Fnr family transcriptional regulator [Bacillota bacterium]
MSKCAICLRDLPIFEGLDGEDFASVCLTASKQKLEKGKCLFHQGTPAVTLYLIKEGTIKLVQYTEEGREIILGVVGRGEVLGETALFQQQKHFASAIALEMVKVCSISLNQFEQLIMAKPALAMKIIANLGQKLYLTMQQLGDVTNNSVADKLTRLFLRLAREYGEKTPEGHLITLNITQQDLANMVGASRVMVAQVLKQLKEKGFLIKHDKHYLIQDRCLDRNFR